MTGSFSSFQVTHAHDRSSRLTQVWQSHTGAVNALIASPIELVKIRLQNERGATDASKVIRQLLDAGVSRGIFRGLGVTILKEMPV
jgi:Mitochondrial carrier protein